MPAEQESLRSCCKARWVVRGRLHRRHRVFPAAYFAVKDEARPSMAPRQRPAEVWMPIESIPLDSAGRVHAVMKREQAPGHETRVELR